MNYIQAFIVAAIFCLVAEIIMEYTKLTPGHMTSLFTILGSFLSLIGVYPKLIEYGGSGATILICNFGHSLFRGAIEGYYNYGFIGLFKEMFAYSGVAITSAVIMAFLGALFFKPKH